MWPLASMFSHSEILYFVFSHFAFSCYIFTFCDFNNLLFLHLMILYLVFLHSVILSGGSLLYICAICSYISIFSYLCILCFCTAALWPGVQRRDIAQCHQECDSQWPLHHTHGSAGTHPGLPLLYCRLPLPEGRLHHGSGPTKEQDPYSRYCQVFLDCALGLPVATVLVEEMLLQSLPPFTHHYVLFYAPDWHAWTLEPHVSFCIPSEE